MNHTTNALCDCERGHNGLGLAGRPCDCQEPPTLAELWSEVEHRWPGSFWHLAKGRLSADEPLYGFQVLFGSDEILAEGEGHTAEAAISVALEA